MATNTYLGSSGLGFDALRSRNVPHIHEEILFSLDYQTFKESHKVCRCWNGVHASGIVRQRARAVYWNEMHSEKCENEEKLLRYSQAGNVEEVSRLLSRIVNPDCVSQQGTTPLFEAILSGHTEVVKLLLEGRADPNKGHELGRTPLHWEAIQ